MNEIGGIGFDREVPYSPEAEVSVIGAMLIEASAITEARTLLTSKDFYREAHRRLFRAITDLNDQGKAVDTTTLISHLKDSGELDATGGIPYLGELLDAVPTASNLAYHAQIVEQKARLRDLLEVSSTIIRNIYEQDGQDPAAILARAQEAVLGVKLRQSGQGMQSMKELLWKAFEEIEREAEAKGGVTGLPSGFPSLDRMTTGMQPGDVTIVAGRPSQGKSAMMWKMAAETGLTTQKLVAIFSLEMASEQLVKRGLAQEGAVDLMKIRRGELSTEDYQRLAAAAGHLNTTTIWLDDHPGGTVSDIRSKLRPLRAQGEVGLVMVDYVQLMSAEAENRTQEVSKVSRGLKVLARELNTHVVVLSQLSRGIESRSIPRPKLSDLRETGALEQDADVVLGLWRPEYYFDEKTTGDWRSKWTGKAELGILKQRNGPTGRITLVFDAPTTRFYEAADEELKGDLF